MWVIQQCALEWEKTGEWHGWDNLVAQAELAKPFAAVVDLEQPDFYNAGNMVRKIRDYCISTGQSVPETQGEIARCVYESMAFGYRRAADSLRRITGKEYKAFRIFGGGCQNRLLNQFAANVLHMPVFTGPVEAAAVGNILIQAMAAGEVADFDEMKMIVERSFQKEVFGPYGEDLWEKAYVNYKSLL